MKARSLLRRLFAGGGSPPVIRPAPQDPVEAFAEAIARGDWHAAGKAAALASLKARSADLVDRIESLLERVAVTP